MFCKHTHTHDIYTHTHTHNGILFIPKKKDILPFVTTYMVLDSFMLSELSQKEKDKDHGLAYMWNLKNTSKKSLPQAQRYREQTGWLPVAGVWGRGRQKQNELKEIKSTNF